MLRLRALATVAPALALVACAAQNNGDGGMIVLENTALVQGATACMFTGLAGQPSLSAGIISSASPVPYLMEPLIESKITAVTGTEAERTIVIEGADITLTVPSATIRKANGSSSSFTVTLDSSDSAFQSLFSGSVGPNEATANVGVNLIPVSVLASIQQQAQAAGLAAGDSMSAQVVASLKIYGELGGSRVDAVPFQYPVTVCNDCVVFDHGACPLTGQVRSGNPCNPYQDGVVDCCETGGALECPGPTM
jgi:hypothetical protein